MSAVLMAPAAVRYSTTAVKTAVVRRAIRVIPVAARINLARVMVLCARILTVERVQVPLPDHPPVAMHLRAHSLMRPPDYRQGC